MLLTTIVWAIAAEESGLWNVEQLYAPGGKSRRLLEALAFTYAVVMALGFLYRQASYSRLVIGISAVALFVLATAARIISRVMLELLRKSGRNEVKILMVGTDRFARRVATSLLHGEVLPCKVVGFVRLPDQEIAVEGPVYEMDQIPNFLQRTLDQRCCHCASCRPSERCSANFALRWRSCACRPGL